MVTHEVHCASVWYAGFKEEGVPFLVLQNRRSHTYRDMRIHRHTHTDILFAKFSLKYRKTVAAKGGKGFKKLNMAQRLTVKVLLLLTSLFCLIEV